MPTNQSSVNSGSFDPARLKHLCLQVELIRSKQHEEDVARFARWRFSQQEVRKDDCQDNSHDPVDLDLLKKAVQKWSSEEENREEKEPEPEENRPDSPDSSKEEGTTRRETADNPPTRSSNTSILLTQSNAHQELAILGRRLGEDCLATSGFPLDGSLGAFEKQRGVSGMPQGRVFGGDDPKLMLKFLSSLSDDLSEEDNEWSRQSDSSSLLQDLESLLAEGSPAAISPLSRDRIDEMQQPSTLSTVAKLGDRTKDQEASGAAPAASVIENGVNSSVVNSRVPWQWIALAGCAVLLLAASSRQSDPLVVQVHVFLSDGVVKVHDADSPRQPSLWCPNQDVAMDIVAYSYLDEPFHKNTIVKTADSVAGKKLPLTRTIARRDQLVLHTNTDNSSNIISMPSSCKWEKPTNIQERFRVAIRSRADVQNSSLLVEEPSKNSTSTNGLVTDLFWCDVDVESSYLQLSDGTSNHTLGVSSAAATTKAPRPFAMLFDSHLELFDMASFLGSEYESSWPRAVSRYNMLGSQKGLFHRLRDAMVTYGTHSRMYESYDAGEGQGEGSRLRTRGTRDAAPTLSYYYYLSLQYGQAANQWKESGKADPTVDDL